MNKTDIVIGCVGPPYGLQGWVKIYSDTEPSVNIFSYQPWRIIKAGCCQILQLLDQRQHNNQLLAKLAGCDCPEQARLLTGSAIVIARQQLPVLPMDEYYWADLKGLHVYTCAGIYLGLVDHLLATGANDVLVIQGEKRHMLPFLHDQVVKDIKLEQQMMTVEWDPNF